MIRTLLKSKIHRVSVTQCELPEEGSCASDENLLEAPGIVENEQIHIFSVNGSAARRAASGDLIIAAFAHVPETEVSGFKPKLVFVDEANRQVALRSHVPVQRPEAGRMTAEQP